MVIIYVFSWDLCNRGGTPEDPLHVRVLQADVVHVQDNPAMGYVPERQWVQVSMTVGDDGSIGLNMWVWQEANTRLYLWVSEPTQATFGDR